MAEVAPEHVAVVVVMYNSEKLLEDLVESLDLGFGDISYELIAVDNDSPDESAARMLEIAPDATVVRTGKNGGYAAGINAGVTASQPHTAVLVLNSDVRLKPRCISELLQVLRQPGVGIAVPKLTDGTGRVITSMRREPSVLRAFCDAIIGARWAGRFGRLGEVITDPRAYDVQQRIDWAEGSTQLISTECWRASGSWDESFFLYSEETEFNLRARDLGFATVFVPTASATHLEGGSGASNALWALQVLNRIVLFRRRHGQIKTLLYWFATLLREASRAAMGREVSRAASRGLLSPRLLKCPARCLTSI